MEFVSCLRGKSFFKFGEGQRGLEYDLFSGNKMNSAELSGVFWRKNESAFVPTTGFGYKFAFSKELQRNSPIVVIVTGFCTICPEYFYDVFFIRNQHY